MISAVMADQPIAASSLTEMRHRPLPGERSILPDSTTPAPSTPDARNDTQYSGERKSAPQPTPPQPSSSMFAAAVLSGALAPTPKTMEELVRRIGLSPIPEESQARLKDLLV